MIGAVDLSLHRNSARDRILRRRNGKLHASLGVANRAHPAQIEVAARISRKSELIQRKLRRTQPFQPWEYGEARQLEPHGAARRNFAHDIATCLGGCQFRCALRFAAFDLALKCALPVRHLGFARQVTAQQVGPDRRKTKAVGSHRECAGQAAVFHRQFAVRPFEVFRLQGSLS